ncbi:MAG: haloacid dehalogenase, IA family protein [Candidatus Bathyarchaeota archaeon B63]|nr:MAG: haloacid dehalogenase, IA family protein [Candidatus Bathyarchaeota archaeon B63]
MGGFRAVLFDLGGTLIRTAPIPEIFLRILRSHGVQVSAVPDENIFPDFSELSPDSFRLPYIEFWRAYNMMILKKIGLRGDLKRLADALTEEWWDNAELEAYPEAHEVLDDLRGISLKTGIVSNGFQEDIREILRRTGLDGKFDVAVGVDDAGRPKPHAEIFSFALKKLGVKPHQSLFVGDDPEADYEGAEGAGLKPLLIDRDDRIDGSYRKIRDLREILDYL